MIRAALLHTVIILAYGWALMTVIMMWGGPI